MSGSPPTAKNRKGPLSGPLAKSILRGEGEFFLIQGVSIIFTIVAGFLLIRNLGLEAYGTYVVMLAMGQMLNALGNSGLFIGATALVAKTDKSDPAILKIFSALSHLRLRATLVATIVVVGLSIGLLYRLGLTSSALFWSVIAALYYGLALVYGSLFSEGLMLLGEHRFVSRYDAGFGVISAISSMITASAPDVRRTRLISAFSRSWK